jgi:outer membrane protein assembly factor BamB
MTNFPRLAGFARLLAPAMMLAALALSGCDTAKQLFTEHKNPPLKGERISVLQLQRDLVANPELKGQPVKLPEAWSNQLWPQAGGYPNHAPGHLALGDHLRKAWRVSIGAGGDDRTPLTATPVVAEHTVFALDTDGRVSAFDVKNGKRRWEQSIIPHGENGSGALGGGIAYDSGKIYATAGYKTLVALNAANGSIAWKAVIPSPARAAPTVMDGKIYLITLDNHLNVLNEADGSPVWSYSGVTETTNLLGSASPAADQSLVVLPLSSGEIYGLRPENGQVAWEDNLSAVRRTGSLSSISDIRGLPVIDQGVVYAVSFSGRMVALDEVSGQRVWQREIGSAQMPWAAGDTIFVVTAEQQVVALTRQMGDIHWVSQLPRYRDNDKDKPIVWSGPVLAGNRLVVVSNMGDMDILNPADGKITYTEHIGSEANMPALVAENTLFVLTEDGELTAWR